MDYFASFLILALSAIAVSDTIGGMLFRAAMSVWLAWAGLISEESYFAFCNWSLF